MMVNKVAQTAVTRGPRAELRSGEYRGVAGRMWDSRRRSEQLIMTAYYTSRRC